MLLKAKNIIRLMQSLKWVKGKLEIYRAMKVDTPYVPNLGVHWTCDYYKAYPYGGKLKAVNDPYFVYTAIVSIWSVDWPATFKAAIGPFPHEKEVVLRKGRKIKIILAVKWINLQPFRIIDKPGRCPDDPETTYKWHFQKEVLAVYNSFYTKT